MKISFDTMVELALAEYPDAIEVRVAGVGAHQHMVVSMPPGGPWLMRVIYLKVPGAEFERGDWVRERHFRVDYGRTGFLNEAMEKHRASIMDAARQSMRKPVYLTDTEVDYFADYPGVEVDLPSPAPLPEYIPIERHKRVRPKPNAVPTQLRRLAKQVETGELRVISWESRSDDPLGLGQSLKLEVLFGVKKP